ncbi:unnamed protein product, partial [Polarella glacialis]
MEVYAWGSGNYGRLGLGHSGDAQQPQLVSGVLNGCEVCFAACSWYHSAVVTSTGDVATFGSKVSKCLGTAASGSDGSEASAGHSESSSSDGEGNSKGDKDRSRPGKGRRDGGKAAGPQRAGAASALGGNLRSTSDFVPHVLRSFPSRVTVVQVSVGSDMIGAHTLAVSRSGKLYSWGYGPGCGLGGTKNVSVPTLVTKFLGTGAGESGSGRARTQEMEPLGWGRHSHKRYRERNSNKSLGLQLLRPRIVKAVCGGGFSAVMSSEGEVFTFGLSAEGRLGFRTKFRAQLRPRRIETLAEGTTDLAAGASFVLLCTAAGKLISWGDNSKGQLGIGHLQESHEPITLGRACPSAFVMQAVAAGDSHSLALDSAGRIYSWGGEGGPMTGQGQPMPNSLQVDAAFQFRLRQLSLWWVRPCAVKALQDVRIVHISAGCLHSLALSQDGALFAWGAPLQAGTAKTSRRALSNGVEVSWVPRLVAPSPKLPLVRIGTASAGGWHSMATAAPCSPLERLLPPPEREEPEDAAAIQDRSSRSLVGFCDGFLVSEVSSTAEEEARVQICCAAVRARLAMPDGTDSPIWRAFSAQVVRLRPESVAIARSAQETDEPINNNNNNNKNNKNDNNNSSAEKEEKEEEEEKEEKGTSSEEGGLMELVALHRERPRPVADAAHRRMPMANFDADEAAGLARPTPSSSSRASKVPSKASKAPFRAEGPGARQKTKPDFSSDSESGGDGAKVARRPPPLSARKAPTAPMEEASPLPRLPERPHRRQTPEFSSDSSNSDEELLPDAAVVAARRLHPAAVPRRSAPVVQPPPTSARDRAAGSRREAPAAHLGLELHHFGEAVLAALVRFLCTDTLGFLSVIDETHPAWLEEQQLKVRPSGPSPGEARSLETSPVRRPTRQRAARGLLLRQEVHDLRRIGSSLGLERLARLCDQLLHRIDAPGAPALFAPASSLGIAMWTLLRQTLRPADRNGPDTAVICSPPGPRRPRWGPRWIPADGRLQAHSFVLCAGCSALWPEPSAVPSATEREAEVSAGGGWHATATASSSSFSPAVRAGDAEAPDAPVLRLLRGDGGGGGAPRYELDLSDLPADVVFAWLRYLYTQDDLSLTWPLEPSGDMEETAIAERFWTNLLLLAQRLGDWKLQLYAQDVLIGALTLENWTQMATFAEKAKCTLLSEAAMMTGVRQLLPHMLASFKVGSGLEPPAAKRPSGDDASGQEPQLSELLAEPAAVEQVATVAKVGGAGHLSGVSRGSVDLELDRRLLELPGGKRTGAAQ